MKLDERIFVIGFIGSDRIGVAREIHLNAGYRFRNLDEEIEKKDGRSILRICMAAGEHGLRNQEYEMLKHFDQQIGVVVACGDGVVLDDDCMEILKRNTVIVADSKLTCDQLWEKAKNDTSAPYAFMQEKDEQVRYEKFCQLYKQRWPLYEQFL